jgi:hypothetical protein
MQNKAISILGWEEKAPPGAQRMWPLFTHALAWPFSNHTESPQQGFPFPHCSNEVCYFLEPNKEND